MTITDAELAEIDALVGGPPDPGTVTAGELADWLGITANRVSALARDGTIPRDDAKRFPLKAAVRAYAEHARAGAIGRRADSELSAEKLRLAKANADKLELANAKARGELIAAAEVERAWAGVLRDVRAAFLALPSRAAGKLGHLTPHDLKTLDAEVRDVLMELADDD
ncbi:DNA packaging protein [Mameliella sediminis]|uniref:DNA packaging protein n=1 Tax=Mameliella sediminis TaxID=2836866 RepID=UPI001C47C494|nr:DNA packaging protein [Mameliella sediminis]MBV7394655.1 DNA packaging protein [Mameliella sediminis]